MKHAPRLETICADAREDSPGQNPPLIAPIYQTAVWTLASLEECEAVYGGDAAGYIYTRDSNPNHRSLERTLALLEQTEEAVVFGSGMAAVAGALTALLGTGHRVVASRYLYGATARLLEGELARFGVVTTWVDSNNLTEVEAALREPAAVVLVETIANPLLQVANLPELARLAHAAGAKLVVDNTFATPHGCRPAEQGADLVVHSVTKHLSGHSDVTLGAVASGKALAGHVRRQAQLWGGSANPFECWLALRGITTFPLRMDRSCANAQELAWRLQGHPQVRTVIYPGLPDHPDHALVGNVLRSGGPMLAVCLRSGRRARTLIKKLERIRFAPSLGDTATTVSYPVATSHRGLSPEWRENLGIDDTVLRFSIGIDHVEDLWSDLSQALDSL